jgi:tetratricopeptide (TPR) repeat protein
LAVASLGEEAKLALAEGDDARAATLYAKQASHGSVSGSQSLLFLARQLVSDQGRLDGALGDPVVQRLIATYLWTRSAESWWTEGSPSQSASELLERLSGLPSLAGADRLAAALFRAGRFEDAQRLVEKEDSAIAHWVKAKLLVRQGKREAADRELERAAEGYPLSELWTFDYSSDFLPRQQVELERSILALAHDDFDGAMQHALAGCGWEDVAYLAERVLDVDTLLRLVDANASKPDVCANVDVHIWPPVKRPVALRALLARRLMRVGRGREALRYFEAEPRKLAEQYVTALEAATAERAPLVRAAHLYRAAHLARRDGMEVLGFEGAPDFHWTGGSFALVQAPLDGGQSPEEVRRCVGSAPKFPVRFHYRAVASRLAEQAANEVSPRSQAFTALLCKAAKYVRWEEPERVRALWHRAVKEGPLLKEAMVFGVECPEPRFVPPPERHRPFHVRKRWLGLLGVAVVAAAGLVVARRRARRPSL